MWGKYKTLVPLFLNINVLNDALWILLELGMFAQLWYIPSLILCYIKRVIRYLSISLDSLLFNCFRSFLVVFELYNLWCFQGDLAPWSNLHVRICIIHMEIQLFLLQHSFLFFHFYVISFMDAKKWETFQIADSCKYINVWWSDNILNTV